MVDRLSYTEGNHGAAVGGSLEKRNPEPTGPGLFYVTRAFVHCACA